MAKLAHAQWSSKMTFVLAAAGSAVGLGNIWRFSYMVGDSGGAAFVLVYLACVALVGLPILVAEWMIGRRGQKNPINTMAELAANHGKSPAWALIGISGVLAAFLILSFYSVIGGWSLNYTLSSVIGTFNGQDADSIGALFGGMLASPTTLLLWHTAFMVLVVGIVGRGVTKGLESAARLMMPALIVLMLVLVGYGMASGYFGEALAFMFRPDWSALTGGVVLAAMGQGFLHPVAGYGHHDGLRLVPGGRRQPDKHRAYRDHFGHRHCAACRPCDLPDRICQRVECWRRTRPDLCYPATSVWQYGGRYHPRANVLPAINFRSADLGYFTAGTGRRNTGRAHVHESYRVHPGERYRRMAIRRRGAAVIQRMV